MALMVGAACAQPALVGPTSVRLPLMPAEPEGIAPKPPHGEAPRCAGREGVPDRPLPVELSR